QPDEMRVVAPEQWSCIAAGLHVLEYLRSLYEGRLDDDCVTTRTPNSENLAVRDALLDLDSRVYRCSRERGLDEDDRKVACPSAREVPAISGKLGFPTRPHQE